MNVHIYKTEQFKQIVSFYYMYIHLNVCIWCRENIYWIQLFEYFLCTYIEFCNALRLWLCIIIKKKKKKKIRQIERPTYEHPLLRTDLRKA